MDRRTDEIGAGGGGLPVEGPRGLNGGSREQEEDRGGEATGRQMSQRSSLPF